MELFYSHKLDWDLVVSQIPGCTCSQGICIPQSCQCMLRGGEFAYTDQKSLRDPHHPPPIFECNDECPCSNSDCLNRVVQNCLFNHPYLEVIPISKGRGRGVRAKCAISRGTCLGIYFGEIITAEEATSREHARQENDHNYILLVRELPHNSSINSSEIQTIVDGDPNLEFVSQTSITSMINHSCDPNLTVCPVRINSPIPYLSFFALRHIVENEEVSYDYGFDNNSTVHLSSIPCLCESSTCRGFLPSHSNLHDDNH